MIPGAKAPKLVTDDMVQQMRPGSVIVDVAVDQGGVIATADRVTTHDEPVYENTVFFTMPLLTFLEQLLAHLRLPLQM